MRKNEFVYVGEKELAIEDMRNKISNWVNSDALKELIEAFDVKVPYKKGLREKISWLLEFSERWDYRKIQQQTYDIKTQENYRWLIESDNLNEVQLKAIKESMPSLGLVGIGIPYFDSYDYIVALGGARYSCLFRPKYSRMIIEQYNLKPKAAVMLSGMRPVSETERDSTDTYAIGAKTEYDLINHGAEKVFQIEGEGTEERFIDAKNLNKSWAIKTYEKTDKKFPIISIAAPSSEPQKRRANSLDTYKFFCEKYKIREGQRLLFITSQIYVPYQHLEAVRSLGIPQNISIDTIGFPVEWNIEQRGLRQAENYLQEVRSTIQAINRVIKNID